jgi:hypothetical protein
VRKKIGEQIVRVRKEREREREIVIKYARER